MGFDKRLQYHVRTMMRQLERSDKRVPRRCSLRPSSFPVCPRLVALYQLRKKVQGAVIDRWQFRSECYTSFGTAMHETYQTWMGREGLLYGKWVCRGLKSEWTSPTTEVREHCGYRREGWGNKDPCPKCGCDTLYYEEYDLRDALPYGLASAHNDGLVYIGDGTRMPEEGDVPDFLLEIKTCGESHYKKALQALKEGDPEPKSHGHKLQPSAYCEMVEAKLGFKMRGVLYVYVNRNHPWQAAAFLYPRHNGNVTRINALGYRIGETVLKHGIMPAGNCQVKADAEGMMWGGMEWFGCPESDSCFGCDGDGGINAGELPIWLEG